MDDTGRYVLIDAFVVASLLPYIDTYLLCRNPRRHTFSKIGNNESRDHNITLINASTIGKS